MPDWLQIERAAPPLTFPFRSNQRVCFIERYYLFKAILTTVEDLKTFKEIMCRNDTRYQASLILPKENRDALE